MRIVPVSIATVLAATLLLSGCAADPLSEQYAEIGDPGYASADGTISEFAPGDRGEIVVFDGTTDEGNTVSSSDYADEVLVVNFWYAACAPCRVEAPDLAALSTKYQDAGASFLGVNVYDQAETSLAFARNFDIEYPSILDANSGAVRLAFAGHAPPSAVPTTLVLDKQGRVAARFIGLIDEPSILDTIISDLIAEEP
ncbi:TlpA family protein disulfide reductase [Microbacterium murale]|uniref:Thiol-disulfide isomerase n=1 Tax=Microbacterium murale TaxID=1081040 RepID=A0ABQ1RZV6_9MICO|nr:TlpA disulfide reductase family protein [Microbacterium murale]GGD86364.1 thiol-disulfide isomerase [Microbacterium murale]